MFPGCPRGALRGETLGSDSDKVLVSMLQPGQMAPGTGHPAQGTTDFRASRI